MCRVDIAAQCDTIVAVADDSVLHSMKVDTMLHLLCVQCSGHDESNTCSEKLLEQLMGDRLRSTIAL